jgi:hypothetical protein
MVEYLFPHFLSDPREYKQAEVLWREQWDDLVRRVRQERLWETPWVNTCSVNETPIQDGNPIFSAISPRRRRAIRVIQLEPSDNPRAFYVWTDTFAEGSSEAIEELVISCVLTHETLNEAAELMRQWITEEKAGQSSEPNDGSISPKTSGTFPTPALSDPPPPSST